MTIIISATLYWLLQSVSSVPLIIGTVSNQSWHFSNSILLHFYNLHTQMCVPSKFQFRTLKAFEVTVLHSSSNRKIDLYSKYRENKLQALTKTDVFYECSEVRTQNLHYRVCHELRNGLLGKLFLLLSFITANKVEIHEETLIVNNRFDVTWISGHSLQFLWPTAEIFELLLLGRIRWYPGFNRWALPSPRTRRVKKLMEFFQNTQLFS